MITTLEPVAALGEFVHPPQQVDGAFEHVGEIEHRPFVQRDAVLRERDREHSPDAARQYRVEIAAERTREILNRFTQLQCRHAMTLPAVRRRVVVVRIGMDSIGAASLAITFQEVARHPVDQSSHRGIVRSPERLEPAKIAREHLVPRMFDRPVGEESFESAGHRMKEVDQAVHGATADRAGSQVRRAAREKPVEHIPRDQPSIEQRREPFPGTPDAELSEHQRQIRFTFGQPDKDRQ